MVTLGEKKSFLLYISSFKQIRKLSQEQKGTLLDAIMNFQENAPLPEMDPLVDMCFGFIADDMQRDNEKYEEIVEKRRDAGRKGGIKTQANQANARFVRANKANATSENQANQANQAVNVNVAVNEDVNVNDDVVVNVEESAPDAGRTDTTNNTQSHLKPSSAQIAIEIDAKGYQIPGTEIQKFIQYNDKLGWRGDWKENLESWVAHYTPQKKSLNAFNNFEHHDIDAYEQERMIVQANVRDTENYEQRNMG